MQVLIIDDESKARSLLTTILKEYCNEVSSIKEAATLLEGVAILKSNKIDILFLDIEMPQHSGLELFDFIPVESVNFEIIFTTAYSEYAIKAFEFSAIDYLLKPLRPNKVKEALELKNSLSSDKFSKLALPVEDGVLFVKLDEIYVLEADGMYTTFHLTQSRKILISKPMKYFSDLLENKELFYKPHRSFLVNLKYLQKVVKKEGTYLEIENEMRIPVSKEKKEELINLLQDLQ
ncbi:LytR/AlgR family response regulator transcription factor [Flavobacterium sp.]|jgi:two-component system LytT family response regulator|uniref:LytR/AlgR family response regulator transcription factor n=1 Tax=Flavobacterium sp. TaxID=239 RepID=UPI0037C18D45